MENQTLVREICPTKTLAMLEKGALLIDVREKEEVHNLSFDVSNSINIPLSEFENRFVEVPKDIDVILVCRVGIRSLRAAGFLVNHGYTNIVNMKHGIERWVQKGFPTKGDSTSITGEDSCCSATGCC